jgi:pyrroline-5-carboxylate reductase
MKRVGRHIGFIGAGNMASALIRGLLAARIYRPSGVWVADPVARQRRTLQRRHGIGAARDNRELVRGSRTVVLAVKPQVLPQVLEEIQPEVTADKLFVSIVAGFPLRRLEQGLGGSAKVVRTMPNTPALLGRGMTAVARGKNARVSDERLALRIFRAVGDALTVGDEALLDPVTGLSGSGPAYVYLFAEALIDGAVREGVPLPVARRLAFQTLDGAAAMLRESGLGPRELREMVTSPGGTTLAGLASLEKAGFPAIVAAAVAAATSRSRELGAAGSSGGKG